MLHWSQQCVCHLSGYRSWFPSRYEISGSEQFVHWPSILWKFHIWREITSDNQINDKHTVDSSVTYDVMTALHPPTTLSTSTTLRYKGQSSSFTCLLFYNIKYQVSHKHSCFSWWWAHRHPKHVKIDKYTKNKFVEQVGFICKIIQRCINKTQNVREFVTSSSQYLLTSGCM
jgi:hypothetical protein